MRKVILIVFALLPLGALAQGVPVISVVGEAGQSTRYSVTIELVALMTLLTFLPSLLLMMTPFVRIIIVMSLLRQALGVGQTPPNQVLIGLALFLTFFIMAPVLTTVYDQAVTPYLGNKLSFEDALEVAQKPVREFMLKQTRQEEISSFTQIAGRKAVSEPTEVAFSTLVPAFITSELKSAFTIGFLIYIPFIVIDLIVASILMSMEIGRAHV